MDFKDSLFLPQTTFQMRGNLSQKEPDILKFWEQLDIYKKSRSLSKKAKQFLLHDGPPFANGTPHAGTAMNKVLKDMIMRLKRMQGFDVPYVPGWDCHGLPIEWKIEEKLRSEGRKKEDISIAEFRDMCKKFAEYWIDVQREGFKRLGVLGDWENPYLTMNPEAEAVVIKLIGKFIVDGTLCRGERPVFWSVVEQTALADAEIEYMDKKSTSIYVAFPIKSTKEKFLEGAECVIWTTTPWTIPANRAISYNKDILYCLLQVSDRKFVIAKDLVENFQQTTGIECDEKMEFEGRFLEGTICNHPFYKSGYDFDVPLIHGNHVETESGTGLVHTAPGHGVDDFNVCREHGIKVPQTVNENGTYHEDVKIFAGMHIFKAEGAILEELTKANALLFKNTIVHSYPHSWRSKAPLIFRTTPQWFLSMDKTGLRKKALAEIEKTEWLPRQGYNRIKAFVENRGDWCISRQRVWGVPIPLFVEKKTGEPLRDPEVIDRVSKIFGQEGSNAWFSRDAQDFLGDKYNAKDYTQVFDTLDVWFESASTHAYVVRKENEKAQADLYLEGSDQHRGWFQHSLLVSCEAYGEAPFKSVLTHGFIVDENGKKMSKSLGNVVTLDDVVKNWGADIFRMWVASSDFTQDLKLGTNILKQLEDVYRKLRNTIRYMLGALSGYDSEKESISYEEMPDLEKWALHRLYELNEELEKCIKNFDINRYFTLLHTFCSGDLSSFFFDIRKDVLYCDLKDEPRRKAYRTVLYTIFQFVLRRLAPIIAFTAEEAWMNFYPETKSSVHLQEFLQPDAKWCNPKIAEKINRAKEIRSAITTALEIARKDKLIGSSLQADVVVYDPEGKTPNFDKAFWEDLAIVSFLKILKEPIPSDAFVLEDMKNIGVVVRVASGEKCERCWKIFEKLNENKVCDRCKKAVG